MRLLLVNLTRFGDLVQSQVCITGLAEQGFEVHLAVLENFSQAARLLRGVTSIRPVPGSRFLFTPGADWRQGLAEFWRFADSLEREVAPEVVANITPSLPGRLLARRFEAARQVGLGLDAEGFARDESPWAAFLQTASRHRGTSPFNVADIFCRVAGLPAPGRPRVLSLAQSEEAVRLKAEELLREAPEAPGGLVALQLGASEDRRRWPLEYFARLGGLLWEKCAALPVLLGGPDETRLAERYAVLAGHPHLSLVGRTTLPELAAVLGLVRLLVSNDTGTMHLAAGMGAPVLAVFLCTAQAFDTGPYQPGALCLEPDMVCHPCAFGAACAHDEACRRAIGPEGVFSAAAARLAGPRWGDAPPPGSRAWITGHDTSGYLALDRLGGGMDDRQAWLLTQRAFYRQFLDGARAPALDGLPPLSGEARAALAATLAEACTVLALLCSQGALLIHSPRPALKTKFLAYWQRLTALLQADPRLAPLGWLLAGQGEEQGGRLPEFLALLERYRDGLGALARHIGQ